VDDRKKIEERLRKKESEIQMLEERLRAAKIYFASPSGRFEDVGDA
jgi:hypothetical protein